MAYNRKEEYLAVVKQPKEITDTLLETIDYIAQARDAELSFDKTIIAEIVSLNNADTGEYFVEYQAGKFRAYTPTNLSFVYSKGTNVYVKIPGGDFTQKKIIEGKVSASSYTEDEYADLSQQIISMGEVYTNDNIYNVIAYASPENQYFEQVIYENNNLDEDIIFTSLLDTYPHLMISADFRTQFYGNTVAGNYGLKVDFVEQNTGIIYSRRLDITNFSGSIYDYEVFSPQYTIYDLTDLKLVGIKKITFFQERFLRYDTVYNSTGEAVAVYDTEPNIFVKNINISFVDIQDTTKNLYYIGISAPQGLSLIQDTDKIKLTGVFYYTNKNILEEKTCKCYWYKQNPAILSGDEKYDQLAGPGWECINDSSNVKFNELTVSGYDVYQQMRYKLIVVYNSSITLSKDVRVVKYYNERFTLIPQFISDVEAKLKIVDAQDKINKADWYVDLLDGSYLALEKDAEEIDISQYLEYSNVIFYTISKLNDENYVPCEYKLIIYKQESPVRVIFNGNDTFQYNDNGSIDLTQANKEIIITPIISVNKENIGIKSITWYSPDGGELFEYPTTKITNSMISKLWVDKVNNALHYYIRPKHIDDYSNNTLTLKVITLTDKEFIFNKTITFIKPGDTSISGLDYSLIIKQCDVDGNEISSIPLNKQNNNYSPIYFKPEIRYNGNKIIDGAVYRDENNKIIDTYKINVEFEPINISCENINVERNIFQVTSAKDDCNGQYFIKFKVIIGLKNKTDINQILYYYQPVMVSSNINIQNIDNINIPSKITYTVDGVPSLSNKVISLKYKVDGKTSIDLINIIKPESLTKYIEIIPYASDDQVKYYLRPQENYPGAYFSKSTDITKTTPMGAIQIYLSNKTGYIIYPIVMLINKNSLTSDQEDNDGTNVSVLNENNLEQEKPLKFNFSQGNIQTQNEGKTYLGSLWEENTGNQNTQTDTQSGYVSGLYQYDKDGIPTNILRSDGIIKLGGDILCFNENGSVQLKESIPTNILTIAKLLNEIANNTELKQQLSNYIAPKNIKIRDWYIEE